MTDTILSDLGSHLGGFIGALIGCSLAWWMGYRAGRRSPSVLDLDRADDAYEARMNRVLRDAERRAEDTTNA